MNYVLLGNVIIGLSSLMIRSEAIWTGFVLVAAVPPAIAVIPFTGILRWQQHALPVRHRRSPSGCAGDYPHDRPGLAGRRIL